MPAPARVPANLPPIPRKWVLIGLVMLLVYLLLKPSLENWLGVKLPGLDQPAPRGAAGAPEQPEAEGDVDAGPRTNGTNANSRGPGDRSDSGDRGSPTDDSAGDSPETTTALDDDADPPKPRTRDDGSRSAASAGDEPTPRNRSQASASKTGAGAATRAPGADEAPLGALRETGRNVFTSTAGLVYRPGSADGHRIDHVMTHASDDLDKPVHGVFDGDREEILAVVDEAYLLAKTRGPPTVVTEEEGERTAYTVNLGRRIGYLGGQRGQQRRRPALKQVRIVLEGDAVVTAYPVSQ